MDSTRCGELPSSARRVIVVRNPHAGAVSTVEPVDRLMRDLRRRDLDPHLITDAGELRDKSAEWQEAGTLRAVVAAGGDGTAGLVANHTTADIPLTILPLGTENLLARYLQLSADTALLAHVIQTGRTIRLDAGQIRVGQQPPKLFLLMVGCGFDADVIRRLHERRRGHITHLSYVKPIWQSMCEYAYPEIQVTYFPSQVPQGQAIIPAMIPPIPLPLPTEQLESAACPKTRSAHWVFVFNAPSYARSLPICPAADPTDGLLDVVSFQGGSNWHGFNHLYSIVRRCHHRHSSVEFGRAQRLRIEATGLAPFQADGDPGGTLPIDIETQAARLTMIVPERWRSELWSDS